VKTADFVFFRTPEGRPVSEAHPDVKNSGAARVDLAIKAEFPSHAAVTDSGKS